MCRRQKRLQVQLSYRPSNMPLHLLVDSTATMLPGLMAQIAAEEPLASVSADGAYDTRACHEAIAERGAMAVIPPRKSAKPWKAKTQGSRVRNEAVLACSRK